MTRSETLTAVDREVAYMPMTRAQRLAAARSDELKSEDAKAFFESLLATTTEENAKESIQKAMVTEKKSFKNPKELQRAPSPPLAEKLLKILSETPSRFKSERRLREEVKMRPTTIPKRANVVEASFKALALDPRVLRSSGDLGVPRVAPAPTTAAKPFAFSARERRKTVISAVESSDFHAKPVPNFSKPFVPIRSAKPLTAPQMPNMPGLAWHERARKLRDACCKLPTKLPLKPNRILLNTDVRALKRRVYNDKVKQRRLKKIADREAAQDAVNAALRAELMKARRASIAQGGLSFIARPVKYR